MSKTFTFFKNCFLDRFLVNFTGLCAFLIGNNSVFLIAFFICLPSFFCFLAILGNKFIDSSLNLKFFLVFTLYFTFLMALFPLILIALPAFLIRCSISGVLSILILVGVFFIWLSQKNFELSYSVFLKNFLPNITFFLSLVSLSFWANFVGLLTWFSFFLIYNHKPINKFFKNTWTPMILNSSLIFNFFRCFLPLPLLAESFFIGELVFNGGLLGLVWAPRNYLKVSQLARPVWLLQHAVQNYVNYMPIIRFHTDVISSELRSQLLKVLSDINDPSKVGLDGLRDAVTRLANSSPILKPFIPGRHSTDGREIFNAIYATVFFPADVWFFFPTRIVGPEYLTIISLKESMDKVPTLISPRLPNEIVFLPRPRPGNTSANDWYLFLEGVRFKMRITDPAMLAVLDNKLEQKALFIHETTNFITMRIPFNDAILVNKITGEVLIVQSKFFLNKVYDPNIYISVKDTNQDFSLVFDWRTQKIYCLPRFSNEFTDPRFTSLNMGASNHSFLIEKMDSNLVAWDNDFKDSAILRDLKLASIKAALLRSSPDYFVNNPNPNLIPADILTFKKEDN